MGMPPIGHPQAAALAPLGRQYLAACQRRLKPDPLFPWDGASRIPGCYPPSPLPFDQDACASFSLQPVILTAEKQDRQPEPGGRRSRASPADAQRLGLFRQREGMLRVDHRFALSNPALVSAPAKKSFVSVNSPIFAWSSFTSTGGGASGLPAPKIPAAPSRS